MNTTSNGFYTKENESISRSPCLRQVVQGITVVCQFTSFFIIIRRLSSLPILLVSASLTLFFLVKLPTSLEDLGCRRGWTTTSSSSFPPAGSSVDCSCDIWKDMLAAFLPTRLRELLPYPYALSLGAKPPKRVLRFFKKFWKQGIVAEMSDQLSSVCVQQMNSVSSRNGFVEKPASSNVCNRKAIAMMPLVVVSTKSF